MTVLDVQTSSALTSELTQLALAYRRNTEGNLRLFSGEAFAVLTQHCDLVSATARALCSTEAAVQEFIALAEIPDADRWLKLAR